MSNENRVKTFYELPNGNFGLVDISRENHKRITALFRLLKLLKARSLVDREKLMTIWKNIDHSNVRKWGDK